MRAYTNMCIAIVVAYFVFIVLSLVYAKLFLRLSSARRDDRLDIFRQYNNDTHKYIYLSIDLCRCVRQPSIYRENRIR